jgi:hypothetical protein
MAQSGKSLQDVVHSLDQGGLVPIIRVAMFGALVLTLTLLYLFVQFRGLSSATAMDQAQIARQLAMGNGFSTQYIRPLAIWQLETAGKQIPKDEFPDFFQSPLNPLINSIPLKLVESSWKLTPTDLVYVGDRVIAGTSILLFFLSVWIWYHVACRLFDKLIALLGCAIILLSDLMWQFSLSGLPQMLLLLLLSGAAWLTLKAMEKRSEFVPSLLFLFGAGAVFGLMVLAHGATFWIFLGWLVFALFYFHPRGIAGLVALSALLIVTLPWAVRNYAVCGNPLGLAGYELVAPVNTAESGYLRSISEAPPLSGIHPFNRLKNAVFAQSEKIFPFLGMNIVAVAFFISLLHRFKSPATSAFRLAVVLMWLGAFVAMGLCGVEGVVSSNQFHVLFSAPCQCWPRSLREKTWPSSGRPMCHPSSQSWANGMARMRPSRRICPGLPHGMPSANPSSFRRPSRTSTASAIFVFWARRSPVSTLRPSLETARFSATSTKDPTPTGFS